MEAKQMIRKIYILLALLVVSYVKPLSAAAHLTVYRFEQIDSLQQIEKRNVLVFIHTDWCRFCRAMEQTTLKNNDVVNMLNSQFYFVTLDAEEKRDILFHGKPFKYKPTGANTGIHELAVALGTINRQVSYPTVCILNADYELIFQYNQFLSAADLIKVLRKA
jgi:thioredoxin-related protein